MLCSWFSSILILLDVEGEIVDDEGGLFDGVLGAGQVDADGLPLVRQEVERLLRITRARIEVGVGGERREERARGVADLHLEGIVGGRGRGLGGGDVEAEG